MARPVRAWRGAAGLGRARRGRAWRGAAWQGKARKNIIHPHPHPEWKRLYGSIGPLIEAGKIEYTYAELQDLSGVDVRSTRGRAQFIRFRDEILGKLSIWFENQRGSGYRIVPASEHVNSASLRVVRARQMTKRALKITVNTRFDLLTDSQKSESLAAQGWIGTLYLATKEAVNKTRRIAGASENPALAEAGGIKNLV